MKLRNKVCVITGGNIGIGLAIAKEFLREGAKIVIFGRDAKTLDEASLLITLSRICDHLRHLRIHPGVGAQTAPLRALRAF